MTYYEIQKNSDRSQLINTIKTIFIIQDQTKLEREANIALRATLKETRSKNPKFNSRYTTFSSCKW